MDSVSKLNKDLWYAAQRGDLEAVKTALAKGADINFKFDDWGIDIITPAKIAENRGHVEIVKYLLSKGADSFGLREKYEANENQNIPTKEKNQVMKENATLTNEWKVKYETLIEEK